MLRYEECHGVLKLNDQKVKDDISQQSAVVIRWQHAGIMDNDVAYHEARCSHRHGQRRTGSEDGDIPTCSLMEYFSVSLEKVREARHSTTLFTTIELYYSGTVPLYSHNNDTSGSSRACAGANRIFGM